MKKLLSILIFLFLLTSLAHANPWAVVANRNRTINTIDLGTSPPTLYGPFLSGQLGTNGPLLDVAITPYTHYALVGNYQQNTIYRINIQDPTNPILIGSLNIGFSPDDIAIAPNGQFALVTNDSNLMAIINLYTFTLTTTYTLTTPGGVAQAVAIAPDNQTVIICDGDNDRIIYGIINPGTGLISESTLATGNNPFNVTISPDGQTVLVANGSGDLTVSVFRITGPGTVVAGVTPNVAGLPGNQQSIAFSPDHQRAYVVSILSNPDKLSWLQINGPGNVTLGGAGVANLLSDVTNRYPGVDVLAVSPLGNYALVGNPNNNGATTDDVALINLTTWAVTSINTNNPSPPVGIDTFEILPTTSSVPTFSEWGMILLMVLLGIGSVYYLRRRRLAI